ncbi:MAG: hypothetical protein WCS70_02080 [Verrucomicrobiota bacterium]
MDNEKLRDLLAVYRPGIDDQDDQFAEFITVLRNDPALQLQLNDRVARDHAIAAKLRSVQPPGDLKARLLSDRSTIDMPANFWRPPQWLSIAAAIIMLGVAAYWLSQTRQTTFPMYRTAMAQFVATEYPLDAHDHDLDSLQQTFAAKQWPATYVVPAGLQTLEVEGGCLREWQGKKVALLCFETKETGDVWLFVVDRQVTADVPVGPDPQIARAGKITTASWTQGEYTYILATENPEVPIQRYF